MKKNMTLFIPLLMILFSGCTIPWEDLLPDNPDVPVIPIPKPTPEVTPSPVPDEFSGVIMLGPDVRNWTVTSKLTVKVGGNVGLMNYDSGLTPLVANEEELSGKGPKSGALPLVNEPLTFDSMVLAYGGAIELNYDKARVWQGVNDVGAVVNANPWVIFDLNGKRYCATWEWLRYGQTSKSARAVAGDHIKRKEVPNDWKPASGERVGFFVSGLIRGNSRNVSERTNVVWVTWP
jgi:hypothetical protein